MAATLTRKRCAGAFLDEPVPAPAHLAKRSRFTPAPAAFAAAAASRVTSAAARADVDGGMEECAGVLVEQMSAAADLADARARASTILKLIVAAVTKRAASALREEEHRRQEALERDNAVLRHGVAALHGREEEAKREAAELRRKVAELQAANYALAARMLGATDSCRFQAFHGGPDVF